MKIANKQTQAPKSNVAQSPRQVSLQKLYRFLEIAGVIGGVLGIAYFGTKYGDRVFNASWWNQVVFGKRRNMDLREPKLNTNKAPGEAPEGMVWIPGGEFYMGVDP